MPGGQPSITHDDLMIVYLSSRDAIRAIYFDSEGNVINYMVDVDTNRGSAVFTSQSSGAAPRFRLTYATAKDSALDIIFGYCSPG
jgi:hypothetical protein